MWFLQKKPMPHQQGVQACISHNCFSPAATAPTQFLPQPASSTAPQHVVLIMLPFQKANTNEDASVFMSAFSFLLTICIWFCHQPFCASHAHTPLAGSFLLCSPYSRKNTLAHKNLIDTHTLILHITALIFLLRLKYLSEFVRACCIWLGNV